MGKYYILNISLILLFLIIPSFFSFSDVLQQVNDFSQQYEKSWYSKKEEYIQYKKNHYIKLILGNDKTALDTIQFKNNYLVFLTLNFYEDQPKHWGKEFKRFLDLSAMCYVAAEIQCATPISMFPELFDTPIYGYEKYFGDRKIEDKLVDYPFMYLAVQCKEKSIPMLKSLINDSKRRSEVRLKAIAILMKINKFEAERTAKSIFNDLNEEMRFILTSYLKNPHVEPWNMFTLYSNRGRSIRDRHSHQ